MSIVLVMPSNHLILCCPLFLQPSIFPSIRVFSNESALHIRWPKYWSFSFSISPSNEHPGLISFRMDWMDLLGVQGTLKGLLQHHGSKASILWCSAFFIVQLSHPYMTTGKTIVLTIRTFVGKVMPLLFNMLSRLALCSVQFSSVAQSLFPLPSLNPHLLIHVLLCVRLKITDIYLCIHPTNPLSCMLLYTIYFLFSCSVYLSLKNGHTPYLYKCNTQTRTMGVDLEPDPDHSLYLWDLL